MHCISKHVPALSGIVGEKFCPYTEPTKILNYQIFDPSAGVTNYSN